MRISAAALKRMVDSHDVDSLLEVCHRIAETHLKDIPIHAPSMVVSFLEPSMFMEEQETFWVLLLNARNQLIRSVMLYKGTVNTSSVRIAEVFKDAIRFNAASIIVAHNHPSGDPTPSPEDVNITRVLKQAGAMLEVELMDHVIVGRGGKWASLKEMGLFNV